jgi:hypothetical protein
MGKLRIRATSEATSDESCTSGPSRPMEVPVLIEKSADKLLTMLARTEILPLPTTIASM